MLKKLQAAQDKMGFLNFELGAFSSHPATVKRLKRLDAKWNKLKNKSGFITYDQPEPSPRADAL